MSKETSGSGKPGLIFLVRHGQTDANATGRFQGHRDTALNGLGEHQARNAGAFLSGVFHPLQSRKLFLAGISCSDLKRCKDTAQLIKETLVGSGVEQASAPLVESALLREINMGIFEGATIGELEKNNARDLQQFFTSYEKEPLSTPYPGAGESAMQVRDRMLDFFALETRKPLRLSPESVECGPKKWHDTSLWNGQRAEIIVSHGAALRILLSALGIELNQKIANAEVLVLALCANQGAKLLYRTLGVEGL